MNIVIATRVPEELARKLDEYADAVERQHGERPDRSTLVRQAIRHAVAAGLFLTTRHADGANATQTDKSAA
jgi:predicted transcriptional regulator